MNYDHNDGHIILGAPAAARCLHLRTHFPEFSERSPDLPGSWLPFPRHLSLSRGAKMKRLGGSECGLGKVAGTRDETEGC